MNNFHIFDEIGRGVHSNVYKGRMKKDIEFTAVKRVTKNEKQRVHKEVKIIHDLKHPNILRFYNWYETNNHLWLILEYCVGGDLEKILQQDMRLPESSVHDFGRDLLAAMQYLHSHGIIHCDLKPSNILLDENGSIKLGGFSVARRISDINNKPVSNMSPASRGTPAYMASELFDQNGGTHSTKSDFWAFGCVLYQCFCGRAPFLYPSFQDLVHAVLHNDPAPMPNASAEFVDLIKRLLDKNPATRITWDDMLTHPFWQFTLAPLSIPEQPALDNYLRKNNLFPAKEAVVTQQDVVRASMQAQRVRESVDVAALSQVVQGNMQAQASGHHQAAATEDGVALQTADAEVQFRVHDDNLINDEGEVPSGGNGADGPTSPSSRPGRQLPLAGSGAQIRSLAQLPRAMGAPDRATLVEGANVQLEELIFRTDTAVRPLVGNKRIEDYESPAWDVDALPSIDIKAREHFARPGAIHSPAFVDFVGAVNTFLSGHNSLQAKCNLLAFLEPVCTAEVVAGAMVNTQLTPTLLSLFDRSTSSALRVRVAAILGMMIRYAAQIDLGLVSPAVKQLQSGLRDTSDKVRRRVMVTMGELLFYLCNEGRDTSARGLEAAHRFWPDADAVANDICAVLSNSADAIAQHYAAKALDNMMTREGFWPSTLATADAAKALLQVLSLSSDHALRSTAASALGRMLRANPALSGAVVSCSALAVSWRCIPTRESRLQLNAMSLLAWLLLKVPISDQSTWSQLPHASQMLAALVPLLDDRKPLTRAKALLLLAACCRNPWFLGPAIEQGLLRHVASLPETTTATAHELKEAEEYAVHCQAAMHTALLASVPCVLELISTELKYGPGQGGSSEPLFKIVVQLLLDDAYRPAVATEGLVGELSDLAQHLWSSLAEVEAHTDLSSLLLQALDVLLQIPDILAHLAGPIIERLMPALCHDIRCLLSSSDTAEGLKELQASVARILAEGLMFFTAHIDAPFNVDSSPSMATEDRRAVSLSLGWAIGTSGLPSALHQLLVKDVLPLLPALIADQDTMPLYAQKILASLLTRSPPYVAHIDWQPLIPRLFDFLSLESPNNNIHNIRICRVIVAQNTVATTDIATMKAAEKVARVLEYASEKRAEPFLEPTTELALALLVRDAADICAATAGCGSTHALIPNAVTFVELAGCLSDAHLATSAAGCAELCAELFPKKYAEVLLSDEGIDALVATVSTVQDTCMHLPEGHALEVSIMQKVLTALLRCGTKGRSSAAEATVSRLHTTISNLLNHESQQVEMLARKISDLFE